MDKRTRVPAVMAIVSGLGSALIAVVLFALAASVEDVNLKDGAIRLGGAAVAIALVGLAGGAWILVRRRFLPVVGVVVAGLVIACAELLMITGLSAYPRTLGYVGSITFVAVMVMVWLFTAGRFQRESQR